MKATFKGKVNYAHRRDDKGEVLVELQLHIKGKVDDAPQNAKDAEVWTTLFVKPIVADQLKIGSMIAITIEEVPNEV
jgi:hypothetical protein